MYDHLDADPPFPGEQEREAVRHKASRLRRRRRAVLGGSGTAVALVAVLVAVNVSATPARTSMLVTDDPTPTATVETSQSPAVVRETPEPTVTVHSTPSPAAPVLPTPTPKPTSTCNAPSNPEVFQDCPDGKPGWSGGFTGCRVATSVPEAPVKLQVFDGLSAEIVTPATAPPGAQVNVLLRFSNTGDQDISFTLAGDSDTTLPAVAAGRGSAVHWTDAIAGRMVALSPEQVVDVDYVLLTSTCGDTAQSPEPPLPAGRYAVGLEFRLRDVQQQPHDPQASASAALPLASPSPSASPSSPPSTVTALLRGSVDVA